MLKTPNFAAAVGKAEERMDALGVDIAQLKQQVRDNPPAALADRKEKEDRRRFLETLYDERGEARQAYERIIQGNDLQDASFLSRGSLVARTVLRIVLRRPGGGTAGYGTGFLVGDGVLITNNHVLPRDDIAEAAEVEAFFERDLYGRDCVPQRFALEPQSLFFTSAELDFTVVAVARRDRSDQHALADLGWLPLIGGLGKVNEGEYLSVIQHPNGERKQVCVRENQLLKKDTDVLWYATDTLAGSSGSPVFNNDWLLVALHHSGVPEKRDGKWQTIDGRDYDPGRDRDDSIKWVANEGIRISRIVELLRTDPAAIRQARLQAVVNHDVGDLRARLPVLYGTGVEPSTQIEKPECMVDRGTASAVRSGHQKNSSKSEDITMGQQQITVTLAVDDDGSVRIVSQNGGRESLALEAKKPAKPPIDAPVDEEVDWVAPGAGFKPGFLDVLDEHPEWHVHLPDLSDENKARVAPLQRDRPVYGLALPSDDVARRGQLDYLSSTVVMNADRRLAFYSAANIDGAQRFDLSRPADRWLRDKRIADKHQLDNSYYSNNKFDRGHLTRREDLEWGTDPVIATRRANGTCTWTNCSPQHKIFNQDKDFPGKTAALWAGLENYILEKTARHYRFRVQSFTGPVFHENDLPYRGAKVPSRFWKLVVAVDAQDRLFATAYVLSQQLLLDRDRNNLDEAAIETPFAQFETYQVRIADLEEEIGMTFTAGAPDHPVALREFDPLAKELAKPAWKRRKRGQSFGAQEAFSPTERSLEDPLNGFADIVLPDDED